ncbi:MAG: GTP 3',8-cyclase MoaA [Bacteroidia bacterium]
MILTADKIETKQPLKDSFQRVHDYLRIALIDKCNFRCNYCMPDEDMKFFANNKLMTADEIIGIASKFIQHGVKKIRLTGGEPLVRNDVAYIIERLSEFPVELCITTNGVYIDKHIDTFKKARLKSVNVSFDSLHESRFKEITHRDYFKQVLGNIHLLINEGFHVKVNMVVMKNVNEDEVVDFVKLTQHLPVHIRFIEFMPFAGNAWSEGKLFTYREMLGKVQSSFTIEKLTDKQHSTSKKYKVPGFEGTFAFITTMTTPFCGDCNRLRLTADGKMKNCLFSKGEADLLTPYRNSEDIVPIIKTCLMQKKEMLGGQTDPEKMENRSMIQIGG